MKIITWNVNSIKVRLARLEAVIERHSPDVICLQELKTIEENFPFEALENLGYHSSVYGQKTYNGVAILSKKQPSMVVKSFEDKEEDPQARFIHAEINKVHVLCAYCPNGQEVGSEKYAYKLKWFKRLRKYLDKHCDPKKPLVLVGDFNIAPENRDVHNPEEWEGKILFSEKEKKALANICDFGLEDTFRLFHEDSELYSWWDYRAGAFPRNRGLRIDFILATPSLIKKCIASSIDRDERKGEKPSDHAPVIAEFK